jgi:signal peptidase I
MKSILSKSTLRKFWLEWAKPILIMLIVTGALRSSLADWNDVPTGSMKPTIMEGDRIWVNKLAYDLKVPFTTWHITEWDNPSRGDIVVFFSPYDEERLVKRVVALPGDTVAMQNNRLFINGEPLDYTPLDQTIINEISATDQPRHGFAKETLGTHHHPILLTPQLATKRSFETITVPEGKYFMMGDNRDNSFDSRFYGCVERKRIVGRATDVVLSLDRNNYYKPRWHRFFTDLP